MSDDKSYDPKRVEAAWYERWEKQGLFGAKAPSRRPPFCIVLPPPNVTGSLHIGHALTATVEDCLVRRARMKGLNCLWLPGTDHAGIATQMVVEREIAKEKLSRQSLGREAFVARVWKWKEQYGSRITMQHKALGASLDWSRERFTLDERSSRAVREAFVRLYEEGLLFRDFRLIHWCPRCATSLSDLEVEHDEGAQGELYEFAYPLAGGGEIVVATTRPETMLGDTAVAVHPDDPRYRALVGRTLTHPFTGRALAIIADPILVDPTFGTGAVKVTPAHDWNDFETGKRHGLAQIGVLTPEGRMNENAGPFAGLDRFEARKKVKEALAERGLERGAKPHVLSIGRCQRCDTIVEPMLSTQWFVKTAKLAEAALSAVEAGKTTIVPDEWAKVYFHWMKNIRDWCVSRQLWWGHRIPAWYCGQGHLTVAREDPKACADCGSSSLTRDADVLDTWFSSGLWPMSTLGWPDKTAELATFYPTTILETGHDILFFWVARMMMFGLHFMGEVPFRRVLLHPMVRDEKGNKMSKTRGNVIDPLDVIAEHGADALRFALASYMTQGRQINLSLKRVEGYRHFGNKLWNATRFALSHLEGFEPRRERPAAKTMTLYDRWILSRLATTIAEVDAGIENFRLGEAASALYRFVWNELCDWYLELSKSALYAKETAPLAFESTRAILHHVIETTLRLLHPFMPFVTEELWQKLPRRPADPASIMLAPFPETEGLGDPAAEREMSALMEIVTAARTLRAEHNIPPAKRVPLVLRADPGTARTLAQNHVRAIGDLVRAQVTVTAADGARPRGSAVAVASGIEVIVPLEGLVDPAAEARRLDKEIQKVDKEIVQIRARLERPDFVAKAPAEVVDKDRAREEELEAARLRLDAALASVRELGS